MTNIDRREFLKGTAWMGVTAIAAGCASSACRLTSGGSMFNFAAPPMEHIRVGVLGLGRGRYSSSRIAQIPCCEVTAICDINEARIDQTLAELKKLGKPAPAVYGRGGNREDWKRLCDSDDVDVVYCVFPRELHGEVNVYALNAGKHVMQEVPGAFTLDECWATVEAAEKNRRHCMMLENCCYGELELLALNVAKKGLLGEIMVAETSYNHDQRILQYNPPDGVYWRIDRHRTHHGNYYPTHGMVPMTKCMDVNRGDRFDYLVSMETASCSFEAYAAATFPEGDECRSWKMVKGDVNKTLIRTVKGKLVQVTHNVCTPRPYSRTDKLIGTLGLFRAFPELMVALEDVMGDAKAEKYRDADFVKRFREENMHPLWRTAGEIAKRVGGHGGMDFVMDLRRAYCLQNGLPLDTNVYDLATWSSIVELSERSVCANGRPVDVPDFTRGAWETAQPFGIVDVDLKKMGYA